MRVRWWKDNGKFKVEMTDADWIEPMDETLNAIENEMQRHDTEYLVENLVSLLRARAVKAAHEVHRLKALMNSAPPMVYAEDVDAASRALAALSAAGTVYFPNGVMIIPKSLINE